MYNRLDSCRKGAKFNCPCGDGTVEKIDQIPREFNYTLLCKCGRKFDLTATGSYFEQKK